MAAGAIPAQRPEGAAGSIPRECQVRQCSHGSCLAGNCDPGRALAGTLDLGQRDDRAVHPERQLAPAAFYGRTNAAGADAALILARQFRQCQDATAGQAVIARVFYDAAGPASGALTQAVRSFGGPAARDGGWDDLAAEITSADRCFGMIVCPSPDRISRRPAELAARLGLASRHGVALFLADDFALHLVPAGALECAGITGLAFPAIWRNSEVTISGGRPDER